MNKYKCVNKDGWVFGKKWKITGFLFWKKKNTIPAKGPSFGDIITKKSEYWDEGRLWYSLVEWPNSGHFAFTNPQGDPNFILVEEVKNGFKEVEFSEIKKKVPVSSN